MIFDRVAVAVDSIDRSSSFESRSRIARVDRRSKSFLPRRSSSSIVERDVRFVDDVDISHSNLEIPHRRRSIRLTNRRFASTRFSSPSSETASSIFAAIRASFVRDSIEFSKIIEFRSSRRGAISIVRNVLEIRDSIHRVVRRSVGFRSRFRFSIVALSAIRNPSFSGRTGRFVRFRARSFGSNLFRFAIRPTFRLRVSRIRFTPFRANVYRRARRVGFSSSGRRESTRSIDRFDLRIESSTNRFVSSSVDSDRGRFRILRSVERSIARSQCRFSRQYGPSDRVVRDRRRSIRRFRAIGSFVEFRFVAIDSFVVRRRFVVEIDVRLDASRSRFARISSFVAVGVRRRYFRVGQIDRSRSIARSVHRATIIRSVDVRFVSAVVRSRSTFESQRDRSHVRSIDVRRRIAISIVRTSISTDSRFRFASKYSIARISTRRSADGRLRSIDEIRRFSPDSIDRRRFRRDEFRSVFAVDRVARRRIETISDRSSRFGSTSISNFVRRSISISSSAVDRRFVARGFESRTFETVDRSAVDRPSRRNVRRSTISTRSFGPIARRVDVDRRSLASVREPFRATERNVVARSFERRLESSAFGFVASDANYDDHEIEVSAKFLDRSRIRSSRISFESRSMRSIVRSRLVGSVDRRRTKTSVSDRIRDSSRTISFRRNRSIGVANFRSTSVDRSSTFENASCVSFRSSRSVRSIRFRRSAIDRTSSTVERRDSVRVERRSPPDRTTTSNDVSDSRFVVRIEYDRSSANPSTSFSRSRRSDRSRVRFDRIEFDSNGIIEIVSNSFVAFASNRRVRSFRSIVDPSADRQRRRTIFRSRSARFDRFVVDDFSVSIASRIDRRSSFRNVVRRERRSPTVRERSIDRSDDASDRSDVDRSFVVSVVRSTFGVRRRVADSSRIGIRRAVSSNESCVVARSSRRRSSSFRRSISSSDATIDREFRFVAARFPFRVDFRRFRRSDDRVATRFREIASFNSIDRVGRSSESSASTHPIDASRSFVSSKFATSIRRSLRSIVDRRSVRFGRSIFVDSRISSSARRCRSFRVDSSSRVASDRRRRPSRSIRRSIRHDIGFRFGRAIERPTNSIRSTSTSSTIRHRRRSGSFVDRRRRVASRTSRKIGVESSFDRRRIESSIERSSFDRFRSSIRRRRSRRATRRRVDSIRSSFRFATSLESDFRRVSTTGSRFVEDRFVRARHRRVS